MANDGDLAKIFQLLDVLAVESVAHRQETAALAREVTNYRKDTIDLRKEIVEHRRETALGFERVGRHSGRLETRIESLETGVASLHAEVRNFRGEFERRVAPLER